MFVVIVVVVAAADVVLAVVLFSSLVVAVVAAVAAATCWFQLATHDEPRWHGPSGDSSISTTTASMLVMELNSGRLCH